MVNRGREMAISMLNYSLSMPMLPNYHTIILDGNFKVLCCYIQGIDIHITKAEKIDRQLAAHTTHNTS
jgi:hypothetical protein